jgi:hypothetical protein
MAAYLAVKTVVSMVATTVAYLVYPKAAKKADSLAVWLALMKAARSAVKKVEMKAAQMVLRMAAWRVVDWADQSDVH